MVGLVCDFNGEKYFRTIVAEKVDRHWFRSMLVFNQRGLTVVADQKIDPTLTSIECYILDILGTWTMSTFLSSSPSFLFPSFQKMWALLVCLDSQLLHMSLEQNGLVTENCNHCSLIGFELCRFLCAIHWRGSITFHQLGHVRVWMNGIPVSWVPFTAS